MKPPTLKTAARLEARARKLWNLRLVDPRAPQYALAESLHSRARTIRETLAQSEP